MGVIFLLSQQPGTGSSWEPPLWYVVERKSAHVVEYAVLMWLATQFFRSTYRKETLVRVLCLALVFSTSYGFLDEIHQFFIFGRGSKVTDVLFDTMGASLAGGVYWLAITRYKKRF